MQSWTEKNFPVGHIFTAPHPNENDMAKVRVESFYLAPFSKNVAGVTVVILDDKPNSHYYDIDTAYLDEDESAQV